MGFTEMVRAPRQRDVCPTGDVLERNAVLQQHMRFIVRLGVRIAVVAVGGIDHREHIC